MTIDQGQDRYADGLASSGPEYARELLRSVESGPATLPSLVAIEMLVLGAASQVLFDEPAVRGWDSLPAEARSEFADDVIANLSGRGLLEALPTPEPDEPTNGASSVESQRLRMHPALAMILVARTFPTWVALCTDQHSARSNLRMFGLGDTDDAFLGVVVETLADAELDQDSQLDQDTELDQDAAGSDGAVTKELRALTVTYNYRLTSTVAAARMLADWIVSPDAPASARQVDLLRHREGEPMRRRRIELAPTAEGLVAHDAGAEAGAAQPLSASDAEARAEWFHQAIRDSFAA